VRSTSEPGGKLSRSSARSGSRSGARSGSALAARWLLADLAHLGRALAAADDGEARGTGVRATALAQVAHPDRNHLELAQQRRELVQRDLFALPALPLFVGALERRQIDDHRRILEEPGELLELRAQRSLERAEVRRRQPEHRDGGDHALELERSHIARHGPHPAFWPRSAPDESKPISRKRSRR
jgi:hypothetical protein